MEKIDPNTAHTRMQTDAKRCSAGGDTRRTPQKMSGAVVTPVAAKRRLVRDELNAHAAESTQKDAARRPQEKKPAQTAPSVGRAAKATMIEAVPFEVIKSPTVEATPLEDECVPAQTPKSDEVDEYVPPSATPCMADRRSDLAMVAAPAIANLRAPQLGSRPQVMALRPTSRIECNGSCEKGRCSRNKGCRRNSGVAGGSKCVTEGGVG
jgi:hypothetical protein